MGRRCKDHKAVKYIIFIESNSSQIRYDIDEVKFLSYKPLHKTKYIKKYPQICSTTDTLGLNKSLLPNDILPKGLTLEVFFKTLDQQKDFPQVT